MAGINKCTCQCGCACEHCTNGNPCCVRVDFLTRYLGTDYPGLGIGCGFISRDECGELSPFDFWILYGFIEQPFNLRWSGGTSDCNWSLSREIGHHYQIGARQYCTVLSTGGGGQIEDCHTLDGVILRIVLSHVSGTTFRLLAWLDLADPITLYDATFTWDCSDTPVEAASVVPSCGTEYAGFGGCGYASPGATHATITAARCVCHCWAVWRSTVTNCAGTETWTAPVHDRTILWDFGEDDCPLDPPVDPPNDCDTGWRLINPCIAERYIRLTGDGVPTIGCDDEPDDVCPAAGTAPDAPTLDPEPCCSYLCGCYARFTSTVSGCPSDPVWTTPAFVEFDYRTGMEVFGGEFPSDSGWSPVFGDPCTLERFILIEVQPCALMTDCSHLAAPAFLPATPTDEADPAECCAQECPASCADCDSSLTVTISGFTGGCTIYNGTWTLSQALDECTWTSAEGSIGLTCTGDAWILFPTDFATTGWVTDPGRPNTDDCPALGTYQLRGNDTPPNDACIGQTATAVVS